MATALRECCATNLHQDHTPACDLRFCTERGRHRLDPEGRCYDCGGKYPESQRWSCPDNVHRLGRDAVCLDCGQPPEDVSGKRVVPGDVLESAIKRLRELLPSFRDPSHYADHQDIALVKMLEDSPRFLKSASPKGEPGYDESLSTKVFTFDDRALRVEALRAATRHNLSYPETKKVTREYFQLLKDGQ